MEFPLKLNLSDYVAQNSDNSQYDLFGVVVRTLVLLDLYTNTPQNHVGSINSGHYTAFTKNNLNKCWYSLSDTTSSKIDEEDIITKNAYILFYRINT